MSKIDVVEPAPIASPAAMLEDLRRRLVTARWPER